MSDKKTITRWGESDAEMSFMWEFDDGEYVRFTDHERVVGELTKAHDQNRASWLDQRQEIDNLRTALAASRAEAEGLMRDAERYSWLRDNASCSISITHNDNHTYYRSAEETMADDPGDYYSEVSEQDRAKMIEQDSIWTIHEYPNTPVGFNVWHAASLDAAIDSAMEKSNG